MPAQGEAGLPMSIPAPGLVLGQSAATTVDSLVRPYLTSQQPPSPTSSSLPDGVTITAGDSQTYTAQSFDQFGNLVADVTSAPCSPSMSLPVVPGPPMSTRRRRPAPGQSPAPTRPHRYRQPDRPRRTVAPHSRLPGYCYHHRRQLSNLHQSVVRRFRQPHRHCPRCHLRYRFLDRGRRGWQLGRQRLYLSKSRHLDGYR